MARCPMNKNNMKSETTHIPHNPTRIIDQGNYFLHQRPDQAQMKKSQSPAHNENKTMFNRLTGRLKDLTGKVSKFQYELEHCEVYQTIDFYNRYIFRPDGFIKRSARICSTYLPILQRELKVISQRPNVLELEMYSDLISKCVTFGEIMMERLEKLSSDNETEEMIPVKVAGPLEVKDQFSEPMSWEIEKIDLVLERILDMLICNIQKMTGVKRHLIKDDISLELDALAKTFLWLVLQDQKSYERVFPTGKEIKVNVDVKVMSYIDQNPIQSKYCTNIVRCIITQEVTDYLLSHLTHGTGPKMIRESITSGSSCNPSCAQTYTETLTNMYIFLEEMNVEIDKHKIECPSPADVPEEGVVDNVCPLLESSGCLLNDSHCDLMNPKSPPPTDLQTKTDPSHRLPSERTETKCLSPAQASVDSLRKVVASAIPGAVFDEIDPESFSPTQAPVSSFENDKFKNREFVQVMMKLLVSRIVRKAKVVGPIENYEATISRLSERLLIEVQDVDLQFTPKQFKKIDHSIYKELCSMYGSAETVLMAIQSGELEVEDCIAFAVRNHLTKPPKKCSCICRFFSRVCSAVSKFCRGKNRVEVI